MAQSTISVSLDNEIQDLAKKVASMNVVVTDKKTLSKEEVVCKLTRLLCPFTWKSVNSAEYVTDNIERKIANHENAGKLENSEDEEEEELTVWTKFVFNLILCYEYGCKGLIESAFEKQKECHLIVEHALSSDFSAPIMGVGLKHVSDACKIFLLMKLKLYEKAIENLHCITDVEDMDCREQASIWGVCGAFYMEYGVSGMKETVVVIKKALQLDSNCGEWYFLLGKALSRVRRIENYKSIPENEEFEALEHAVEISDTNTVYMVLLAQSYVDAARQLFCCRKVPFNLKFFNPNVHTGWKSLCKELNEKAFKIYKKAYENSKDNVFVLSRCAYGFQKLPPPLKSLELARDCIHRSLKMKSSNSFVNQTAAVFYRNQNEMDKAKSYFACAAENGSPNALVELMVIKLKENKLYDPVPDMESYIDRFKEKSRREYILGLLGAFYFFVKNDFNTALKYWQQLMDNDMNSTYLKALYNKWNGAPPVLDISKTIITEVVQRLECCNEEEMIMYKNVLVRYKKHQPQLVESIEGVYDKISQ